MADDRMEVNTELYGLALHLPSVPVRVAEAKPVEEAAMTVTFSSSEKPGAKSGMSWLEKMRLSLKTHA
ncbi:hypothetical protein [Fimbriimonas ginsengisoli]|uniref:Uncharacterized protein n=1 Tax=Fimbriimonas ginsengisoli Gsoil 348 TaxID=661478 RepID=A0A068NX38_FIMGI|nr:hypothetical protein [Fimbriimonas ginsengisoli]AIE87927.1 hypothetical protein OP10G_4559 [Fimbriimonas ginsengisoli Gsoil 348]